MYKKSSVYILTVWTVNDVLVDPYSFFVLVDSYTFYCIKKEWIDQNKQGYGSTKTSLTVHAVDTFRKDVGSF